MTDHTQLSGIVLVDKPAGSTSHDMVARARRTLKMKKIGHAGTLDPFATGLLILMVGEGTKLSDNLMSGKKKYRAEIRLGEKTDTGDLTGEIVENRPYDGISEAHVHEVLARFKGEIMQMPPMYSALKKNGVPLYRLARKGIEVERKKRKVFIDRLDLDIFLPPLLTIDVICSKGTYVRTLAEDIAEASGTCAHLASLRRLESGTFSVDSAISYDQLGDREEVALNMIPLKDSIPQMPEMVVRDDATRQISNGLAIRSGWVRSFSPARIVRGEKVKVVDRLGRLISIAEVLHDVNGEKITQSDHVVGKSVRVFNAA